MAAKGAATRRVETRGGAEKSIGLQGGRRRRGGGEGRKEEK